MPALRTQLHVEDIVAVRHTHAKYSVPYFLGCVNEQPVSVKPNERLRVLWLESPQEQPDGGYVYPIQSSRGELRGWVDECVRRRPAAPFAPPLLPLLRALLTQPRAVWLHRIAVGSVVSLVRAVRAEEHQELQVTLTEAEHHAVLQAMGLKIPKKRKSLGSGAAGLPQQKKQKVKVVHPPSINVKGNYTCLWCLRMFGHPPAWTVHSKTCTHRSPLWLRHDPVRSHATCRCL